MAVNTDKFIQGSIPEILDLIEMTEDQPMMIWGQPGLGKTKGLYSRFKEPEWKIIPVLAGCSEPTDLTGIPFPYKDSYAKYLVPQWAYYCSTAPDVPEEFKGKIILFLDDIVTAPEQTQAAFFKLVHEKRVGDYLLRENVRIIAAGNRLDDKSAASPMPMALANRFFHIEARVDHEAFLEWGRLNGIHPNVMAFIRVQPNLLSNFDTAVKQSAEMAFATPRSWESVSKCLHSLDRRKLRSYQGTKSAEHDEKSEVNFTFKVAAGLVGKGVAIAFNTFIRNTLGLVSPEEIMKDPMRARVPGPTDLDVTHATVSAAEHYVGQHPKSWEPFAKYALRLQPEFGLLLGKQCVCAVTDKLTGADQRKSIESETLGKLLEEFQEFLVMIKG